MKLYQEAHLRGDAYYSALTRSALNRLPMDKECGVSGLAYLTALEKLRGHLQALEVLDPEDLKKVRLLIAQTSEYIDLVSKDLKVTDRITSPDGISNIDQETADSISGLIG